METGIGPNQDTKAAHWTRRLAGTLPFQFIKEKETFTKIFVKYKISSDMGLIL